MPDHPEIIPFQPSYQRPENGVQVLKVCDIPLPSNFKLSVSPRLVYMAPAGWGGNHRHGRREAFVGMSEELYFVYRDDDGKRHETLMKDPDGTLRLIVVPPGLPHMIENRSAQIPAVIYELLDIDDGPAQPLTGAESLR